MKAQDMQLGRRCDMFSESFNLVPAWVSLSFLLDAAVAIHRHRSLVTLRSAREDPSGGRRPAQIQQVDTQQASKESHNLMHNPASRRSHSDQDNATQPSDAVTGQVDSEACRRLLTTWRSR